ncbi:alpha/beta hydrolase [Actinosynnema sp. NPDC020468]|uniref:alpha/beta hydrolase n=1 Tax=Actinosynnema sp. NPDC020468 TaxID=3154488 RepID=UPI003410BF2D
MTTRLGAVALAVLLLGSTPGTGVASGQPAWHDCVTGPDDEVGAQLAAVGARCAEITVPLDYRRPDGRTVTLAIARRAATDRAHRLGTLLVNTGGPGPSRDGVFLVAQGIPPIAHGAPEVAARYDLVGVDPRFFGLSAPLECGWPTNLALRNAQYASPDRASFERSAADARDLASRCADKADVLPHASTRNIARDLDRVRAALGERKVSYLGWSYGTYLGAVYTQLFPTRLDRVVLDSAIAPDAYGPAAFRETAPADAAALADWARWAAARDATYRLGATTGAVLAAVGSLDRGAPFTVGTHRIERAMVAGLLLTVDDTDASYAEFAAQVRVLVDAARGQVVTPTPALAAKLALYEKPEVTPEFGFSATTANQCADRAASRDPETYYRDIRDHLAAEPLYGPLARDITPCAFWPTSPVEPPTAITTGHPALIVGASGDPSTPYPGQRALRRAMGGSRMITLDRAYRHGVYLFDGAACVDGAVDRYLLTGVLPPADVTCSR